MAAKKATAKKGTGVEHLGVRSDGKRWWKARIKWRDPLTGKMREAEQTFEADSKVIALQKRAAFLREKLDGATRPTQRKKLGDVIDEYLATVDRPGTLHSYRSWGKKIKKARGEAWIDALTAQHYQTFLASVYLGKTSMDSIRVVLINAWDHAKGLGYVAGDNPVHDTKVTNWKPAPARGRKRKALTTDETVRLHAYLRQHSYDMHVMLLVQYVLACRFGEVSALEWPDIDLATGHVRIRRQQKNGVVGPIKGYRTPKNKPASGTPEREAALGPTALGQLLKHRERMAKEQWPGWETLVFPCPAEGQGKRPIRKHHYWDHQTPGAHLKAAYAALGLDLGAVTHVARHTANNMARMHANETFLRKVIGHSSAKLTATYSEIAVAEVVDFAREQERRLLGPSGSLSGSSGGRKRR
jgi:integrase